MQDANLERLTAKGYLKYRSIIAKNLVGGIAWGVGSVIGATIIVAILIGLLRTFNFLPGIGGFFNDAASTFEKTQLRK